MRIRTTLLACLTALPLVAVATPAEAASTIRIGLVQYDSPGTDTGSNKSLNAEYVTVKNTGSTARGLKGWKVRDETGYTYTFGAYKLGAGRTVRVHTGKGSNTARHRYWGRSWYVWNNTGDTVKLIRKDGTRVDTCKLPGTQDKKAC